MKRIDARPVAVGLCLALAVAAAAQAQGRPDARNLTCDQARALVWQHGGIVMTTGRHTYDRYVSSDFYCMAGEVTRRAYVPTRDTQSCPVGYRCVPGDPWEDRHWWLPRR